MNNYFFLILSESPSLKLYYVIYRLVQEGLQVTEDPKEVQELQVPRVFQAQQVHQALLEKGVNQDHRECQDYQYGRLIMFWEFQSSCLFKKMFNVSCPYTT